ncbi:hypothetical protein Tco_1055377 [Tanacetum coccineum]|uniref:Uncharacterized protein n=1 Tax=Tanacetum coccineum TaxID=301880 RepID=A0ABQ5GZG9_9ASTR
MEEINNFQQESDETLFQVWERFKELLMKCPQHYLTETQEGMPQLLRDGLFARMAMEHRDEAGGSRRRLSWRQFILALGLHTREEMESHGFARPPKKVTMTDLFYLRGLDVRSVNIHYLLARYLRKSRAHISGGQFVARYLRRFADGRKSKAHISGGQFIIDMAELVRLQIYVQLYDTWVWVANGPERQPDAIAGARAIAEDAPAVDEGDQAVLAPVQAPQQPPLPPPAPTRTMPQRMARLEKDVHEIHGALTEQCEGRSYLYTIFSDPYVLLEERQTEDWRG